MISNIQTKQVVNIADHKIILIQAVIEHLDSFQFSIVVYSHLKCKS